MEFNNIFTDDKKTIVIFQPVFLKKLSVFTKIKPGKIIKKSIKPNINSLTIVTGDRNVEVWDAEKKSKEILALKKWLSARLKIR